MGVGEQPEGNRDLGRRENLNPQAIINTLLIGAALGNKKYQKCKMQQKLKKIKIDKEVDKKSESARANIPKKMSEREGQGKKAEISQN